MNRLLDIQEAVLAMGIKWPKKTLLARIGKVMAGKYREKYFRDPPRIPATVYGREFQVFGYEAKDRLMILGSVIEVLEGEIYRGQDRRNCQLTETSLKQLAGLKEDYDLFMLGVLHPHTWEKLEQFQQTQAAS